MKIIGIGTATPEFAFTQADRFEIAEQYFIGSDKQRRVLPVLIERTGVTKRHSCLLTRSTGSLAERQSFFPPGSSLGGSPLPSTGKRMQIYREEAGKLTLQSVRDLLDRTGIDPSTFTHLVTVSCTGFSAPGFDLQLIDEVPLPRSIERTHVGFMGCHGGLNGLRVARAITAADPRARVLLCATELCSLHYQYSGNADQLVANALFADGSIALAASGNDAPHQVQSTGWDVTDSASVVLPDSQDLMSWTISDTGFQMSLSPTLPTLIQSEVRDWLQTWLKQNGLTLDEIRSWAVHPGGPRILSSFQQAMSLPDNALHHSFNVLHELGNMSSATVFFILQRMITAGDRLPCVACGFGPGITIEATLLMPAG